MTDGRSVGEKRDGKRREGILEVFDTFVIRRPRPVVDDRVRSQGTHLTLVTDRLSEHISGAFKYAGPAVRWLMDRFAGKPVSGAC